MAWALALAGATTVIAPSATAADDETEDATGDESGPADDAAEDEADATAADTDEADEAKPSRYEVTSPPDSKDLGNGLHENAGETYMFVGARYRLQMVPKFIQNIFAEGGETLWVNTPGVEFAVREDRVEYNFFAMLGMYSMMDVPFKGNNDVELAWETITANYNILFLGADFMWGTPDFSPGLSMVYGVGMGMGVVFGEMTRTQAYPSGDTYVPCAFPGDPNGGAYCDGINNHYNGYVEPSWADGGSSPLVFPWIAAQVGLRYKMHRNFVARLETGFTVTSVFFGIGADYGL